MGRRSNSSYLMWFDLNSYLHDLDQALKPALRQIRDLLVQEAKQAANRLPFKDSPVRLAGGGVTSDRKRKQALINSIVGDKVSEYRYYVLRTAVKAMVNNFKNSHIGIYYEFGTGEAGDDIPPKWRDLEDPNPARTGKKIVSRGRDVMYRSGRVPGVWRDMGGNMRITGSRYAGGSGPKFREYIGEDILAYYWFRNATTHLNEEALRILKEAVKKVHPGKYLSLRPVFVLGKD
ncbi:hypothetical protein E308F_30010 [Moorella sp. E308F]|uniref:hypothetical protein n=1 Tax=Moorella sp. E308F TaxID=2572682 RepID=UPI0010FFBD7D|nr:hypothetical protein [Moorella sp. E308F]GEA16755.1 hypothetical protein E308F_30010 [Moorella sp. E308F]